MHEHHHNSPGAFWPGLGHDSSSSPAAHVYGANNPSSSSHPHHYAQQQPQPHHQHQQQQQQLQHPPQQHPHSSASSSLPSPAISSLSSSTSSSKAPKKPTKRIRISTACINCRHKKIKCDGQTPCAHCEKFRVDCIYPVASKPANQEYVETLENRLKSVESHLQGLLSRGFAAKTPGDQLDDMMMLDHHLDAISEGGTDDNQPQTPSSAFNTSPSIPSRPILDRYRQTMASQDYIPSPSSSTSSSSHPPPSSSASQPPLTTANHSRSSSRQMSMTPHPSSHHHPMTPIADVSTAEESNSGQQDGSIDILQFLMGDLKVDRDGAATYINKHIVPGHSYLNARHYDPNTTPSPSLLQEIDDWANVEITSPSSMPLSILSPRAIGALLEIYFNSVHTFLPILHKPSFMTLCQNDQYRVPPFLLLAICAVATRHATEAELSELPELAALSTHALYDHARALVDSFIDVPRLCTIQGLLLLSYYQLKEKRPGHFFRVRMYVTQATRLAMDMRLHRAIDPNRHTVEKKNRPTSQLLTTQDPAGQRIVHLESHLAWLGCFFMDGLISGILGRDYCVLHTTLDLPRWIQEAHQSPDSVQGATLVFWYHHLELVQIYRRICELYRPSSRHHHLTNPAMNPELHAINAALESWLPSLPPHLVYRDLSKEGDDTNLPSYYTLYLHRFYYSHKLSLFRPYISSKQYRGSLHDPQSPLAKCAEAANKLTHLGEIIFQNYSWPWPGCGLFAYNMLQAAEVHIYLMATETETADAQSLYYRTMDLIKGYTSLANLPGLEKKVLDMEAMVAKVILIPRGLPVQTTTMPAGQFGATLSDQSPPPSGADLNDAAMFSPTQTPFQPSLDSHMSAYFSPSQQQQQQPSFGMSYSLQQHGFEPTSLGESMAPFFSPPGSGMDMNIGMGMNMGMYGPNGFGPSSYQTNTPTDDLLGLGLEGSKSSLVTNSGYAGATVGSLNIKSSPSPPASSKKSAVPPPKPPKRIAPQSTGNSSCSSTATSSSNAPPVPHKPNKLKDLAPRPIAPKPRSSMAPPPAPGSTTSSTKSQEYVPIAMAGTAGAAAGAAYRHGGGGSSNGSFGAQGNNNLRPLPKCLPAQETLYGMGVLANSLGVEQYHPPIEEPVERQQQAMSNSDFEFLSMNPHLYNETVPPNQRRPVL